MSVIKWVVFGLGGFAFLISIVFSVMLLLSDPVESTKKGAKNNQPNSKIYKEKNNGKNVNNNNSAINKKLLKTIAGLEDSLVLKNKQIDSLKQMAEKSSELEQEIKKLTAELKGSKDRKARAKDMAKTLSSMKAKTMSPILNKLDDKTVMLIYEQTSKTLRKDILAALKEDRAARITNKLINDE